jgi:anti-anti-sigma factor
MALTLHICPADGGAVVWASGDVDTNVAETFQDMMLAVMRRHSPSLLLDLSGVSFMDCAGLRALLLTQRRAGMRGGSLSLIAESPAVRRIIDLLGVRDLFPVRVGAAVDKVRVGDMVSAPFNVACGHCQNCEHELTSYCLRAKPVTSRPTRNGWPQPGPRSGCTGSRLWPTI